MNDKTIRSAWKELEKLFGPDYSGRNTKLKNAAQNYAQAVLSANDTERIGAIGKKNLSKVAEKELDGKQFDVFLVDVTKFERRA